MMDGFYKVFLKILNGKEIMADWRTGGWTDGQTE